MDQNDLIKRYNYEIFTAETALPWLNFENSPQLGEKGPDFPLWQLDGSKTSLSHIWSQNLFTIVEFGSFT